MSNSIYQLKEMGILKSIDDEEKFINDHFIAFDDVPDSYVYNADGTYTETYVEKLGHVENKSKHGEKVAAKCNSCCE